MNRIVLKNTIMLYCMTVAKMLFPLITLPYLTRILSVDCYGIVSYMKSVMTYMQLIVDFGFMLSGTKDVVNALQSNGDVGQVTGEILLSRLLLSVCAFFFLILLSFGLPILRGYMLYGLLSFGSVFLSVFLHDFLFRGIEKMHVITMRFLLMRTVSTALTFVLVHDDSDLLLIPVLDLLGTMAAVVLVALQMRKLNIRIKIGTIKSAFLAIKKSATYFFSNMATTVFGAFNTLLIGVILPASEIAYWSVSLQIISTIQSMYSPIIDSIYPEMIKSRSLLQLKRIFKVFMPIVLCGCAFSIVVARPVFLLIGGPLYEAAASTFRCLVPVLAFSFPAMLFGWPSLGAVGKERLVTTSTIVAAVFQIVGMIVLMLSNSFSLISVAIFRCVTEGILLALRLYFTIKCKESFVNAR